MTPLVLGVGNDWRGDDGAGLEVARMLRCSARPGARIVEYQGEPSGLIDAWQGEGDVVLVDAVSSGAPSGTVHRLDLLEGPLPPELFRASTHHLGVPEVVELARALERLPSRLELYGIEGRDFDTGVALGPEVRRAVEQVAGEIAERLGD
jgi:hydrogenase maturation protease